MPITITCNKCGFKHTLHADKRRQKNFFGMIVNLNKKTLNCKKCNRPLIKEKQKEENKDVKKKVNPINEVEISGMNFCVRLFSDSDVNLKEMATLALNALHELREMEKQ